MLLISATIQNFTPLLLIRVMASSAVSIMQCLMLHTLFRYRLMHHSITAIQAAMPVMGSL